MKKILAPQLGTDSAVKAYAPNSEDPVRASYSTRAREYADLLGSMAATHESDRDFVLRWANRCDGPAIDAGCGPGHWTEYLRLAGSNIEGVDAVPEFIAEAKLRHPETNYRQAVLPDLNVPVASLGGVLAWYSLIHVEPPAIDDMVLGLAKFLRPNGEMLLGFFAGSDFEPFDHQVVTAYSWPIGEMTQRLEDLGFEITAIDSRTDQDARPHGAISARLSAR